MEDGKRKFHENEDTNFMNVSSIDRILETPNKKKKFEEKDENVTDDVPDEDDLIVSKFEQIDDKLSFIIDILSTRIENTNNNNTNDDEKESEENNEDELSEKEDYDGKPEDIKLKIDDVGIENIEKLLVQLGFSNGSEAEEIEKELQQLDKILNKMKNDKEKLEKLEGKIVL